MLATWVEGEDLRVIAYFKQAMQWAVRSSDYLAFANILLLCCFASFLKRKFLIRFQQGLSHRLSLVPPCMQPGSSRCGTFSSQYGVHTMDQAGGKGRDHATKNKPPFLFPTHPSLSPTFFRWQQVEKNPPINSSSSSTHSKYGLKRHLHNLR